jgi:plasmid maintenance system antidote protein VapI
MEQNMDNELSLSELTELTGLVPRSAGLFLSDYLKRKGLSENQAAKSVGCAASTINRLTKGGELTAEMAAKLNQSFGLSIQMLFNLEAGSKAYQAEKLVEQLKFA